MLPVPHIPAPMELEHPEGQPGRRQCTRHGDLAVQHDHGDREAGLHKQSQPEAPEDLHERDLSESGEQEDSLGVGEARRVHRRGQGASPADSLGLGHCQPEDQR